MRISEKNKLSDLVAAITVAVCLVIPVKAVLGQQAPAGVDLGNVVVTAAKQETLAKDTPGSISVVDAQIIDEQNIRTTEEMTRFVPNLFFKTATSGDAFVSRGISTIDTSLYSPLGFYIDDVAYPLSYMQSRFLFDIERIEVLKGPQSTLYGQNSSSGVINMVSAPQGNEPRARVLLEAGSHETFTAGAMVGGAMKKDKLFYTVSALKSVSDGYMENTNLDSDTVSDNDGFTGRASLRFTPSEALDITLALDGTDRETGLDDLRYLDGPSATQTYKVLNNQASWADQDSFGQSLVIKYAYHDIDVVSVTSHQDFNRRHTMDSDRSAMRLGVSFIDIDRTSWTQELRLSSSAGGFFSSWLLGAYASTENLDNSWDLDHVSVSLANTRVTEADTDRLALFGRVSKALTEKLTATAGLRLDHAAASGSQIYTRASGVTVYDRDITDTQLLPMASLSWKFSHDTMGYLTFSTGWMTGGYDVYSATTQDNFAYDPEYTRNYEAGIKTSFFDNRLRADFSVFYTDITDKQIREEAAGGSVGAWKITNAADAHTQGVELELRALPIRNLELFAALGYTQAEIDDWTGTLNGTAKDYSGCTLPWAPALTANAGFSYTHESGWYSTANVFWAGRQYFDAANTLEDDGYVLVNFKAGYRWRQWDIALWCKNLFDQEYAQKMVASSGYTLVEDGAPRTLGITLCWRW
ncbi:TonB-dependent receptor [uncultured Desulfobacter sp.]|uniref:TonB-dependent receptor n=1 Tax=uncultured Desulfobacter sp. TaxID=240139 RepID=UPI0029F500C1|nr:TonB-dependent receptor [uncultured Desulfobacter sp.]